MSRRVQCRGQRNLLPPVIRFQLHPQLNCSSQSVHTVPFPYLFQQPPISSESMEVSNNPRHTSRNSDFRSIQPRRDKPYKSVQTTRSDEYDRGGFHHIVLVNGDSEFLQCCGHSILHRHCSKPDTIYRNNQKLSPVARIVDQRWTSPMAF